jgi:phage-related protein
MDASFILEEAMKKVTLAELMALPEDSRRKVLNAMQVVHENRKRVKELISSLKPSEKVPELESKIAKAKQAKK